MKIINFLKNTSIPSVSFKSSCKGYERTQTIMLDVIIALLPAIVWGCLNFGLRALFLVLFSAFFCTLLEFSFIFILTKKATVPDLSATLTGILISLCAPVTTPFWMIAQSDIIAVIVIKALFGGLGNNIFNPALVGRISLFGFYLLFADKGNILLSNFVKTDVVSSATPLESLSQAIEPINTITNSFLGKENGLIGEVSVLMLLIGGIYLLYKKIITWHIPISFIASYAIMLYFLAPSDLLTYRYISYELFSGSLFLIAFFMATDCVTSPTTPKGKIIYGIGCGVISVIFRVIFVFGEYLAVSVLIMNVFVRLIDKLTKPARFGCISANKNKKTNNGR